MPTSGRGVVARALGHRRRTGARAFDAIGGGFGRRLLSDYAAEAAVIAKAIDGAVMVSTTAKAICSTITIAGGDAAAARRRRRRWPHRRVGPHPRERVAQRVSQGSATPHSTESYGCYVGRVKRSAARRRSAADAIPNARLRYGNPLTGVPTGAWRAPAHVVNAFTIERRSTSSAGEQR
jgi:hypothetical protein